MVVIPIGLKECVSDYQVFIFSFSSGRKYNDCFDLKLNLNVITVLMFLRSTALVSPTEDEYELILTKIRNLMEEGRGETIFEVKFFLNEPISIYLLLPSSILYAKILFIPINWFRLVLEMIQTPAYPRKI